MSEVKRRIDSEKIIVEKMIRIYCKGQHHDEFCDECIALVDYANQRIDKCPFIQTKSFCSSCKVHCYKEDMRIKIKKVMRYSGPRLFISNPVLVTKHLIEEIKQKRRKL